MRGPNGSRPVLVIDHDNLILETEEDNPTENATCPSATASAVHKRRHIARISKDSLSHYRERLAFMAYNQQTCASYQGKESEAELGSLYENNEPSTRNESSENGCRKEKGSLRRKRKIKKIDS